MLKILLCAALFCCSSCRASEPHISLVVTLDPGESVMIKSSDGEHSTFIDYTNNPVTAHKNLSADESYHIEYHLIIWAECPACHSFYNAAQGPCRNQYCPSKIH